MSPLSSSPPIPPTPDAPHRTGAASIAARGLVAGSVAAGALLGMLLGFGRREGTLWRPLNAAAHTLIGGRADGVWGYQTDVTLAGGAVVLVVSFVAGLLVARLVSPRRFLRLTAAAAGVSLTGYLFHLNVVARTPGGLAALLSVGQLRALYLALGIALLGGMRLAFYDHKRAREP
jgi:hypothetical protein